MTDALKEKAVDVFKPVSRQTCLKVTLIKNQMDAGTGLTVQGCVWHLPCPLYNLPQCCRVFLMLFSSKAIWDCCFEWMFPEMHSAAVFLST